MDNVNLISDIIQNLGFPIAICVFMGFFIWKLWNKQNEDSKEREMKLYEMIGKQTEVNERLTATNQSFVEILNHYENDIQNIKSDVQEIKVKIS